MAITLTNINPNDPISNGPNTINNNFSTVKTHIDNLENLLNPSNNTLKLTNVATIPANSIESASITLTGTSGNLIVINPNGTGATYTVSFEGDVSCRKIVATGTGGNKSTFVDVDITGAFTISGTTTVNGKVKFTGSNAQISYKYRKIDIVNANTGAAAATPIDPSKDYRLLMNYDNGGVALSNSGEVKLDTTGLEDGQVIEFRCFGDNASGMKFYNGTGGSEVFAFIEPNGAVGYQSIAAATKPEFSPAASSDNQSWMICQWMDIGSGTFRLVILDSKNMSNVN